MNIKLWIHYAELILSCCDTPRLDAEILISYVLGKSLTWIKRFDHVVLNDIQLKTLYDYLTRRMCYEPIAYIIQKKEFWSLSFIISKNVLIPRTDTEILVEKSLNKLKKSGNVLDLGSGCGNISLSIAFEKPYCYVIGIDYSLELVLLSQMNAINLNIQNVYFMQSNWFSMINKKFDLIVSNPPYISIKDIFDIKKDLKYEPYCSLVSKNNGICDISYIICHASKYLLYKGWLLIEHGIKQDKIVHNLFKQNNFVNITSYKDYGGIKRITEGQKMY